MQPADDDGPKGRMTRRGFMLGSACSLLAGLGLYGYLNDQPMSRPPVREGMVLADLHAHPSRHADAQTLMAMLSWGVTGLAIRRNARFVLSYDQAVQFPGVREIDKGLCASLSWKGSTGYFVKAQEVQSTFHVLAVGCPGGIENYPDSRRAVEEIHRQKGLAILNHPMMVPSGSRPVRYRWINDTETRALRELCTMVDEVEVFNAQAVNLIPGLFSFSKANAQAQGLAKEFGFKGIASSDAHYFPEQVKVAGIYVKEHGLCIDALKESIKTKAFERFEQYVSRWSFLKGYCW